MASKVRDELTPEGKKLMAAFQEMKVRIGFQSRENARRLAAMMFEVKGGALEWQEIQ